MPSRICWSRNVQPQHEIEAPGRRGQPIGRAGRRLRVLDEDVQRAVAVGHQTRRPVPDRVPIDRIGDEATGVVVDRDRPEPPDGRQLARGEVDPVGVRSVERGAVAVHATQRVQRFLGNGHVALVQDHAGAQEPVRPEARALVVDGPAVDVDAQVERLRADDRGGVAQATGELGRGFGAQRARVEAASRREPDPGERPDELDLARLRRIEVRQDVPELLEERQRRIDPAVRIQQRPLSRRTARTPPHPGPAEAGSAAGARAPCRSPRAWPGPPGCGRRPAGSDCCRAPRACPRARCPRSRVRG